MDGNKVKEKIKVKAKPKRKKIQKGGENLGFIGTLQYYYTIQQLIEYYQELKKKTIQLSIPDDRIEEQLQKYVTARLTDLNSHDRRLIHLCRRIGMDNNMVAYIIAAQTGDDIKKILRRTTFYNHLAQIITMKKQSSYYNFQVKYKLSDSDIAILDEKRSIYD